LIEVNLLPGGKRRGRRGPKLSFNLPSFGGGFGDKWVLGAAAVFILLAGYGGFLFWTTSRAAKDLAVGIEAAQADSARYVDEIAQNDLLEAREESILQRADIIQEIDEDRYIWPHILDEVARALPEYTWLTEIVQVSLGGGLQFQIDGRAGNNFAVTQFMENLEASLFISNVDLISAEQVAENTGGLNRAVTSFSLEAFFDRPPPELLETVPLFRAQAEAGSAPPPGF
jgi:Tfp pilus assembly protein PilN